MGANLHSFIYNMLIDMSCNHLTLKISDEDMLNTRGLVPLTEHQKVGWRLIKVANWDNKNYKRHDIAESAFTL